MGMADPRPTCRKCGTKIDPKDYKTRAEHDFEECIEALQKETKRLRTQRDDAIRGNQELEKINRRLHSDKTAMHELRKRLEALRAEFVALKDQEDIPEIPAIVFENSVNDLRIHVLRQVLERIVLKLYWDGTDVRLDPLSNGPRITREELHSIREELGMHGGCTVCPDPELAEQGLVDELKKFSNGPQRVRAYCTICGKTDCRHLMFEASGKTMTVAQANGLVNEMISGQPEETETECVVCHRKMIVGGPPDDYMCEPCAAEKIKGR